MAVSRYGRKKRLMGEINVVPYIDVMLVLLIIFMVMSSVLHMSISHLLIRCEIIGIW